MLIKMCLAAIEGVEREGACCLFREGFQEQGSPTSGLRTSASCQTSGSIRLEMNCTISVVHLIHPQTIPSTPRLWKNCLP